MDKSNSNNGKDNTLSDLLDILIIVAAMDVIGVVRITPGVQDAVNMRELNKALIRHNRGDWGDLSAEDKKMNNWAVENDERVLSAYTTSDGLKFWIVTEADRSSTTVLLPDEY
jgi:hypothetical protein